MGCQGNCINSFNAARREFNRVHDRRYDAIAMNDSHTKSSFLSPQTVGIDPLGGRWQPDGPHICRFGIGTLAGPTAPRRLFVGPESSRPLCWPLAGLLKNRTQHLYRSVRLCLVWLYFIEGVVRALQATRGWVCLAWLAQTNAFSVHQLVCSMRPSRALAFSNGQGQCPARIFLKTQAPPRADTIERLDRKICVASVATPTSSPMTTPAQT